MLYKMSREELKTRCARQYKEGDCVKVGKYFIWIGYGKYASPLKTRVSTDASITDLRLSKWPRYISDFTSRLLEECKDEGGSI